MGQMVIARADASLARVNPVEQLIILEIGRDKIDTANAFVEYLFELYSMSKSAIWYNLKKLKCSGVLDFADKDCRGKQGLSLTRKGLSMLGSVEQDRAMLENSFMRTAPAPTRQRDYGIVPQRATYDPIYQSWR